MLVADKHLRTASMEERFASDLLVAEMRRSLVNMSEEKKPFTWEDRRCLVNRGDDPPEDEYPYKEVNVRDEECFQRPCETHVHQGKKSRNSATTDDSGERDGKTQKK